MTDILQPEEALPVSDSEPMIRYGTTDEMVWVRQKLLGWRHPVHLLDLHPETRHFVLEDSQGCAGGVSVGLQDLYRTSAVRSYAIALNPEYRGSGWGTAFLASCMEYAADHDVEVVWDKVRREAWGFFEQHGFTPRGTPVMDENIGMGSVGYVQQIMCRTL